ncbi:MAG: MBL fold metallo-hydrolase [Candidatus Tyrphobacter sp.]
MDLPLEDTFGDILKKAMRGTGSAPDALARATGIDAAQIGAWSVDRGVPDDAQVRVLAAALRLVPERLADAAASRWYPAPTDAHRVARHAQHPHPSNGYVFFIDGAKRSALVDPAGVPENLLRVLRDGAYALEYILITHKHADHCDATAEVAAAFPAAKIVIHRLDAHAIGSLAAKATLVRDGEELPFGDGTRIRMIHTPGHTDGSSSYVFQSTVFTGDTLFAGSVGGAYGDVSTYGDILNSIRSKLFTLPAETVVMPGHGPPTTVAQERAHNPFFP